MIQEKKLAHKKAIRKFLRLAKKGISSLRMATYFLPKKSRQSAHKIMSTFQKYVGRIDSRNTQ